MVTSRISPFPPDEADVLKKKQAAVFSIPQGHFLFCQGKSLGLVL